MTHHKDPHLAHPKYRPDIDGLRAIAILSVVIFHAFRGKMPGGFIGVDIFFVISGFLISTIIFSSIERDRFSLVEFYVRRVRRIFPALILVLFFCLAFGWFVLFADEYSQLGKHIAAGAGFIQNFILWRESGYFDNSAETKPLLHLWSLAIEEQFYIFWPLLLAFVWKCQWSFLRITSVIAAVSFAANIYLILSGHPTAAFYLPFSRFWELMVGGVLAYVVLHRPQLIEKHKDAQSFFGFALILAGLLLLNKGRDFPGWWALLPTLGAFFIISAGPSSWLNEKLLANKLMVWIGLISYPLYLWHWLLLSFAQIFAGDQIFAGEMPSKLTKLEAIALAFLLAWITYRFVEIPIRSGKHKRLSVGILLGVMVIILSAGIATTNNLLAPRNSSATIAEIAHAYGDWGYPEGFTRITNSPEGVYELNSNVEDTTLFFGDSHIEQYGPKVVDFVNKNPNISHKVIFVTKGGCPPIPDVMEDSATHKTCEETREYGFNLIRNKNIRTVVIGACWNCYFTVQDKNKHQFANFANGKGAVLALLKLEEFIHDISDDKRVRVVLLLDNPSDERFSPKSYLDGNRMKEIKLKPVVDLVPINQDQIKLKEKFIEIAKRQHVEYIDTAAMYCKDNMCKAFSKDGTPIYKDDNHIRPYYVKENATFIESLVAGRPN